MFGEKTKEFVKQAIGAELDNAISTYGERYASLHEGYAVLKEEVDEVRDERVHINNKTFNFWGAIKIENKALAKSEILQVRNHAEKLALEAVQVAAVCNKILNGL